MQLFELVQESGVPAATVKYYLREGLLPPGRKVSARVSEYDETHVRRLRLIRVLREVGGLSVAALRDIVETAEDEALTAQAMFCRTADAIAPALVARPADDGHRAEAERMAEQVVSDVGWTRVRPEAADRESLVSVLEALLGAGPLTPYPAMVRWYADQADAIARFEISMVNADQDRESLLEEMVVGSVVLGELLVVMRRLAQEHHSAERFDEGGPA